VQDCSIATKCYHEVDFLRIGSWRVTLGARQRWDRCDAPGDHTLIPLGKPGLSSAKIFRVGYRS